MEPLKNKQKKKKIIKRNCSQKCLIIYDSFP